MLVSFVTTTKTVEVDIISSFIMISAGNEIHLSSPLIHSHHQPETEVRNTKQNVIFTKLILFIRSVVNFTCQDKKKQNSLELFEKSDSEEKT